eukprot:236026_1
MGCSTSTLDDDVPPTEPNTQKEEQKTDPNSADAKEEQKDDPNTGAPDENDKKDPQMALPTINPSSLTKYAKAVLKCDLSKFNKNQQQALLKLREASVLMDEIFVYQCTGKSLSDWTQFVESEYKKNEKNNDFMDGISKDDYLRYLTINMGPWDRLNDEVHEQKENPKLKGVNFYPRDMTKDEFQKWVDSFKSEDETAAAKSFFTMIVRDEESKSLQYVPYNEAYKQWLEPAAQLVQEAADLVENESLKEYLSSRSKAFLSNTYQVSDINWLNIEASDIDVTIGPYETYEDELLGLKAAFESFICVTDRDGSAAIQLFADKLQDLENNLPCDDIYKNKEIVQGKPIVVVDEIAIGGDRGGAQTAAFNLPNDEKVTTEHGNKLVILRNIQQAKFENVLQPISEVVIDPKQRELVTFDAFFNHILCHEMCHSLGPHELDSEKFNGNKNVREALGELHSAIEEAKADIAGLYSLLYLIEQGLFKTSSAQQVLVSFLASCFRSIRFGLNESHGKGIAIQLNWILENGGFLYDDDTGYFSVDFENVHKGIASLTKTILEIQGKGDVDGAKALINKYALNQECTQKALAQLQEKKIPVDIQPCFEWIGLKD